MRSAKHGRRAPFVCKQEREVAVRKLDPEGVRRFAHFSQAVLVEVPGPTLYVAGQGDVTGDFEIQARKAWTQIEVLLNEAGMTLTDVVKVTGYVVDRNHVSAYRAVFLEVMGEVRPASTLVICDLVHPAMLVEIEIVATKN
jgi:enamine deaminase RidA (YjgF/YER057c/UK114 family)